MFITFFRNEKHLLCQSVCHEKENTLTVAMQKVRTHFREVVGVMYKIEKKEEKSRSHNVHEE